MTKRIGVAGILRGSRHEHVVLGRRGKDPNRGLFVLPGGGVEDGESLEKAFCREIREETGLIVKDSANRWDRPFLVELEDRIILFAEAELRGSEEPRVCGSDLYDVKWMDLNALRDLSPVALQMLMLAEVIRGRP